MMDRFEIIKAGDSEELVHTITEEDVQKFASLTGDYNPLHMDEDYAARTSFKKRVVHGMLTASFISTIIGFKMLGKGALWLSQNLEFITPARIGDVIRINAEVLQKSLSQRVVVLKITISNQHGQKVIGGEVKVKILPDIEEDSKMEDNIKGAAIVTGASRGIGAATALKLAKDGFSVIVNYHSSKNEAETVLNQILDNDAKGSIFRADVRNFNEVEKMVNCANEQFGSVDVLVNNATSMVTGQSFEQLQWEEITKYLDIQIKGAFNTCKAVVPIMTVQKKGKIINVGSIYGENVPPEKMYGYVIAKSGLMAFTRSLALECGPKGLNINSVSPGMTDTALIADVPEKKKMVTEMQTPLRRLAKPEDIANVISFLASESADYLTGETIRVCGGQLMI